MKTTTTTATPNLTVRHTTQLRVRTQVRAGLGGADALAGGVTSSSTPRSPIRTGFHVWTEG